jgi:hypothetical protein
VAGSEYLKRKAPTLLKFAKATTDPQVAASLVEKAADLKELDEQRPKTDPGEGTDAGECA